MRWKRILGYGVGAVLVRAKPTIMETNAYKFTQVDTSTGYIWKERMNKVWKVSKE
jgi:hypothetical protein